MAKEKNWYKNNSLESETEYISYYTEAKGGQKSSAETLQVELSSKAYFKDGALSMEFTAINSNDDLADLPKSLKEYIAKNKNLSGHIKCGVRKWFFKNKKLSYEGVLCGEHIDKRKSFDQRNDYLLEKTFNKNRILLAMNEKLCSACPMLSKYFDEDGSLKAEISEMNFFKYSDSPEYQKTQYVKYWGKKGLRFHRYNELDKDSNT